MKRRTVLQSIAAAFVAPHALRAGDLLQGSGLTEVNIAALRALAEVALPAAIGRAGRDRAVDDFAAWVRNYREGADTGHGYGSSTLSRPTGASPAARYPAQFVALDDAARAAGGSTFAALPPDKRREIVIAALNTPSPVQQLRARPTGANLVADFMGFWFNSPAAYDLAYEAEIGKDSCRSLEGSDRAPERRGRGSAVGNSGDSIGQGPRSFPQMTPVPLDTDLD